MTAHRRTRLLAAPLQLVCSVAVAPAAARDEVLARLVRAAEGGVRLVQLRGKQMDTPARRRWIELCRAALPAETLILVNDDVEAVFAADGTPLADGVHLGRQDAAALAAAGPAISVADGGATAPPSRSHARAPAEALAQAQARGLRLARRRLGPELLLGTSTRTVTEVAAARAAGCDYVGFGAMAPTATKRDTDPAEPGELARAVAAHPGFPIFPIGGLGPDNLAPLVLAAGCRRAAIGSAVLDAPDVAAAAAACLALLGAPVR